MRFRRQLDVSSVLPKDCIQSLFERFVQAFGCCSLLVQLFKPIGVKSGQVALTRTAKILVMCTVSGLVDVVMKHFSCMLIAKASFGQVDTKGNTQGSDQSGLSRTVV